MRGKSLPFMACRRRRHWQRCRHRNRLRLAPVAHSVCGITAHWTPLFRPFRSVALLACVPRAHVYGFSEARDHWQQSNTALGEMRMALRTPGNPQYSDRDGLNPKVSAAGAPLAPSQATARRSAPSEATQNLKHYAASTRQIRSKFVRQKRVTRARRPRVFRKVHSLAASYNRQSGWGGIRTPGGLTPTAVFKTAALDRSATHPEAQWRCGPTSTLRKTTRHTLFEV